MLILCCPRTGTSCQSNFSQLHRTLTLWGCIGGGLCSRDGSVSLTLDSQSYLHLVFPLSGSRSVPPSSHVSGAPLHYQGWRNTKLNVIPFMLIKKNLSYWLKKQKNLPQKQIILSQPGSEIFSGFLFLDINLFLCLDFRIFTNMASFSLFNFKYALLAQVIKLFIRNICFLCFYPYYRYLIMLRGQTSFWLMWGWAPSLKCVLNLPPSLNSHCSGFTLSSHYLLGTTAVVFT